MEGCPINKMIVIATTYSWPATTNR